MFSGEGRYSIFELRFNADHGVSGRVWVNAAPELLANHRDDSFLEDPTFALDEFEQKGTKIT